MERICWICFTIGRSRIRLQDERKPPGSPESQVDVLGLLCDTDSLTRASEGFIKQFMARLSQKHKQFCFPNLVDNLFFAVRLSAPEGFHMAGCIPFPPFQCSPVTSPMKHGCVVENACVQVDTYPNHMVRSVHEFRLLERGDENPWMDDPSQP